MPATLLRHAIFATIDGTPTPVYEGDGQHGVDRPIGTGSVTLRAPMPAHIDINAPIEVQGGYTDGVIRTLFSGRVTDTAEELTDRGALVTVNAAGWASLLDWEEEQDLTFAGPITLYEIVRSLCTWRGVPAFRIDAITAPDGVTTITLGGVPEIDGGTVVIPRRTSPLAWLRRTLGLVGYRIFDTPDGTVRVQRVSGAPNTAAAATYVTGENLYSLRRTRDVRTMATYITVTGPTYTDSDGVSQQPRSIAASIPESQYLLPPGYRAADIKDDALVTDALAEIVRNVAEIDGGAPTVNQRWETRGDALRAPGEVVSITSSHLATAGTQWLMATHWRIDERSYTVDMEGWAGGGTMLAGGINDHTIPVQTAPLHIGDETVPWYAVPTATRHEVSVTFTVPDTYTSIRYECLLHGSNSQFIGGTNTDLTLSKVIVTQFGEEVGSADMPIVPEDYARQLDYTDLANWQAGRGPLPGRLEPGLATVTFRSGENPDLPASTKWDDWEIRDFVLVLANVGVPTLPTGGS